MAPPPGHPYAVPGGLLPVPPRPTWLSGWGFGCSIGAIVLPLIAGLLSDIASFGGIPISAAFIVLSPISALLGIVFSAMGMSRRYTRRGFAIAGLVVGILVVVLALAILVSTLAS